MIDPATTVIRLIALTQYARDGLGMAEMTIDRFPFRVGRECRTAVSKVMAVERRRGMAPPLNDLYLVEPVPQLDPVVSREHFLIDFTEGKFVLTDRGSPCGTIVNGKIIGGDRRGGHTELHDQDEIALEAEGSPFVFKFRVEF